MRGKDEIVLPGEKLFPNDQMRSGKGTYESHGLILSEHIGRILVHRFDRIVEVEPLKKPHSCVLGGDKVICRVSKVENDRALLELLLLVDSNGDLLKPLACELRLRDACDTYIQSIGDIYREGDILLADTIRGSPFVLLKTTDETTGLIRARCPDCNLPLKAKDMRTLICPGCDYKRESKISKMFDRDFRRI